LALLLQLNGYCTHVAYGGADALATACDFPPHVVLFDVGLPGMDGFEFVRRLLDRSNTRRPLLIAISGFASVEHRRRAGEVGIDLFLTKPADPEKLLQLLESYDRVMSQDVPTMPGVEQRLRVPPYPWIRTGPLLELADAGRATCYAERVATARRLAAIFSRHVRAAVRAAAAQANHTRLRLAARMARCERVAAIGAQRWGGQPNDEHAV
jgi:DNA-binding response OmpR family regulator